MTHPSLPASRDAPAGSPWRISELPSQEQPVERLMARGCCALSTTELLSVLLSGHTGRANPLDFSARLLIRGGSLRQISALEPREIHTELGLTKTAASKLAAALELARRMTEEEVLQAETLSGAEEAFRFLKPRLSDLPREVFSLIFLNQKHGVLAYKELFRGSIQSSAVHPREVVKAALKENAAAVLLAHNHPSGHLSPSPDDLRLTEDLKSLLQLIDVRVVDHLILGGNGYFSFAREGLLFP